MTPTWPEITRTVTAWAERYRVIRRVWVFGSVARGESQPSSDLDLAVELFDDKAFESTTDAWFEFVDRWRTELGAQFSLPIQLELMDSEAKSVIVPAVSREGRLAYEAAA